MIQNLRRPRALNKDIILVSPERHRTLLAQYALQLRPHLRKIEPVRCLPRDHGIDTPSRYKAEILCGLLSEIDVAELGTVNDGGARLGDHGRGRVGGDYVLEGWGEAARDQAMAGAELEEGVGGTLVVAEECVVEGLRVSWAERGVGGGGEGGFAVRVSQYLLIGSEVEFTHANVAIASGGMCICIYNVRFRKFLFGDHRFYPILVKAHY